MGYSLQEMHAAHADLIHALKMAHPGFHVEHTGGGCFVIAAELGHDFHLAVGGVDGPLVFPDDVRGPLELFVFHEEGWGNEWPSLYREEREQLDPLHRELVAVALGAARAFGVVVRTLFPAHVPNNEEE